MKQKSEAEKLANRQKANAMFIKWRWLYTGVVALTVINMLFSLYGYHQQKSTLHLFLVIVSLTNTVLFSIIAIKSWRLWYIRNHDMKMTFV